MSGAAHWLSTKSASTRCFSTAVSKKKKRTVEGSFTPSQRHVVTIR